MNEIPGEAHRRHITVLFCDLVGSTELSERLDPEDLFLLYEKYRNICSQPVSLHNGKIVKYLGDGIVACFGYPRSLDNCAQAAANAALEIQQRIKTTVWARLPGNPLSIRVGIHSGETVVGGYVGESGELESDSIVGLVPNLASRIQNFAPAGEVWISRSTRDLLGDYFDVESEGEFQIRGVSKPMELFQLNGARALVDQAKRIDLSGSPPLVGRTQDLKKLTKFWEATKEGRPGIVRLAGEAGVGKTRLAAELRIEVESEGFEAWDIQCSPYHQDTALFAILDFLQRLLGISGDMVDEEITTRIGGFLERFALRNDRNIGLLAASFNPLMELAADNPLAPNARKEQTQELLHSVFRRAAEARPILVEFNDIHWIDPSSLEVLKDLVVDPVDGLCLVISNRSASTLPWETSCGDEIPQIKLASLSRAATRTLAENTAKGKSLPKEVVDWIHRHTGGVPFYIEELTRAVVESGDLLEQRDRYEIGSWSGVSRTPVTLHDVLLVRLEQLGRGKILAQMAATIGPVFSKELLEILWQESGHDAADFNETFLVLLENEIVVIEESGGGQKCAFRHVLIQKAAYDSLLKSTRQKFHRWLADYFLDHPVAQKSNKPALVARHLDAGGRVREALPFWMRAAHESVCRSAHAECLALVERCLRTARKLPDIESSRESELVLTSLKLTSLIELRGYGDAEVENCVWRIGELSDLVENFDAWCFPGLFENWLFHLMRGNLSECRPQAERLLSIAEDLGDEGLRGESLWAMGATCYWSGELRRAREFLELSIAGEPGDFRENADRLGQHGGVAARIYLAFVLCHFGEMEGSVRLHKESLEIAESSGHPATLAFALGAGTRLRLVVGDLDGAIELGWRTIQFCQEQLRAFWLVVTKMLVGRAMMRKGEEDDGIRLFEEAYADYEARGTRLTQPFFLGILADCKSRRGDFEAALESVDRGLRIAHESGEIISVSGLLLAKADILLRCSEPDEKEAERLLVQAIEVSQSHGSQLYSCRAIDALASLYRKQRRNENVLNLMHQFGGCPDGHCARMVDTARQMLYP